MMIGLIYFFQKDFRGMRIEFRADRAEMYMSKFILNSTYPTCINISNFFSCLVYK